MPDADSAPSKLQERVYDELRRRIRPAQEAFVITPEEVGLDRRNDLDMDAFYSAVRDLEAEQYLRNDRGMTVSVVRPEPSDRDKSFFEDHRAHGRTPEEEIVKAGLSQASGAEIARSYPEFTDLMPEQRYTLFERIQRVNGDPWAFTVSAFPFEKRAFETLIDREGKVTGDVFACLRAIGKAPTRRIETFSVRFPFRDESEYLALQHWPRVPALVAVGRNCAGEELVELYLNVMRADRYIIRSDREISHA